MATVANFRSLIRKPGYQSIHGAFNLQEPGGDIITKTNAEGRLCLDMRAMYAGNPNAIHDTALRTVLHRREIYAKIIEIAAITCYSHENLCEQKHIRSDQYDFALMNLRSEIIRKRLLRSRISHRLRQSLDIAKN